MKEYERIIEQLQLQPHVEGGYFNEIYRSSNKQIFKGFDSERNFCASIYYLLKEKEFSRFHRIKSDELWHYYSGNTNLILHILHPEKGYLTHQINSNNPFFVVEANIWFAASLFETNGTYVLSGCTTSPAFDYKDLEIANSKQLMLNYSNWKDIIRQLS